MATAVPEFPVLARDEAFEMLYRRYVRDVYHYALALLRNPADAEDVTQTTFLNAYRAFCRGEEIQKPHNWLIRIAHNVARTRYAHASRRVKEVPLDDHLDQLAVPEDDRPEVAGVLRALGRLPFNQRAALVMRELEGRSYLEIADTLGVSVAAVETLIFRGRRSLRVRASALRSLGAVPLPASLAQLFEGGGVVAGGGAVFSGGFVVKAAVALVVGALGAGLGGDRSHPVAAASPVEGAVAGAQSVRSQTAQASGSLPRTVERTSAQSGQVRAGTVTPRPSAGGTGQSAGREPVPDAATSSTPQLTAPATVPTLPAPAPPDPVQTVEQTVTSATQVLPVSVPPVPPLPVPVPQVPPVPPVPPVPTLP
jgi:RNA polymerase sigma factor (sigma-70 family)